MKPAPERTPDRQLRLITWLIVGSVAFAIAMIVYSAVKEDPLTEAELLLFQLIILGLGLIGSYLFGRRSAADAAREVIRPHAISAFRRVISLYEALRRFIGTIEDQRARLLESSQQQGVGSIPLSQVDATLELFVIQITEQIGTANDAADDWRDIVPEEVERVEQALKARQLGDEDR